MYELLFGLLSAVIVAFLLPPLVPQQARGWFSDSLARVVGAIIFLFAVASTSYVRVPDGHLGQLYRVYGGGPLTRADQAVRGENGPQTKTHARLHAAAGQRSLQRRYLECGVSIRKEGSAF
jgi:hypothetical protein